MPSSTTIIAVPHPKIMRPIERVTINSLCGRGRSRITSREGGNEAMAIAAKVSMMMLTQRICTTVSGISEPAMALTRQMTMATKLMVSWKRTKR